MSPTQGVTQPAWRICIDFGTAASKASICAPWRYEGKLTYNVHPLRLGAVCEEPSAYVAHSALLFDKERIFFGWNALKRANENDVDADVLQSFKTFLAAADLRDALHLKLRRSIDPSSQFSQRDALTLYVAYLLRLTDRAASLDTSLPQEARNCLRRYAYPNWKTGAEANTIMATIFDAGASIADALGDELFSAGGVGVERGRAALREANAAPGEGRIEAGVYEAQAAAECHFAFTRDLPAHVIVFDMGAGTTDITAFELDNDAADPIMREVGDGRRTVMLACDEIDKLLVSYIVERAKTAKRQGSLKRLWRSLMLRSRVLKEQLFTGGKCEITWGGERLVVRLSDFMRDKQFSAFRGAIAGHYRFCLTQLSLRAAAAGRTEIGVVLAGGGATLPFVQEMAAKVRPVSGPLKTVSVQPLVPDWARDKVFGEHLAPIFPQVAISIGGAVAQLRTRDLHF